MTTEQALEALKTIRRLNAKDGYNQFSTFIAADETLRTFIKEAGEREEWLCDACRTVFKKPNGHGLSGMLCQCGKGSLRPSSPSQRIVEAENARLRSSLDDARRALEPFAAACQNQIMQASPDDQVVGITGLTAGNLRKAASTLSQIKGE